MGLRQIAGRVLVVEDDTTIRMLLVDILRTEGYAVTEAANGVEALERVRAQRPDLILVDLMMPCMDGRSFAHANYARNPLRPSPILLMSASPRLRQIGEQLRRFGVRGVVSKPFDVVQLIDAVAAVLAPVGQLAAVS